MTITSGFAIYLHGRTVPVKLQDMLLEEYSSTKSSFHTNVRQIISQISIAKRLPKRLNLFTFSSDFHPSYFLYLVRRYFQHAHFIPIVGVGKRGEY